MKRVFLLCVASLVVSAAVASAAPTLTLAWDTCVGDGGASVRTFACTSNTNSGTNANTLVPAIVLDANVVDFNGFDTHVIIGTETPLPAWWGNNCTGKAGPVAASSPTSPCTNDPFAALGGGGNVPLTGTDLNPNPNAIQIRFAFAVPEGNEQLLTPGEWPTVNVTISNAKTTGTGSCAGCTQAACLRFNLVTMGQKGGVATDISDAVGSANLAYWQSNTVSCTSTPTRNRTWGAIKSLYR